MGMCVHEEVSLDFLREKWKSKERKAQRLVIEIQRKIGFHRFGATDLPHSAQIELDTTGLLSMVLTHHCPLSRRGGFSFKDSHQAFISTWSQLCVFYFISE